MTLCNHKCTAEALAVEGEKEKVHRLVRSQVLNAVPLPSLSHAYALVAQEEHQQLMTASRLHSVEAASFITSNINRVGGNNSIILQKTRHTKDNCFELHNYLERWDKGYYQKPKQLRGHNVWRPLRATILYQLIG